MKTNFAKTVLKSWTQFFLTGFAVTTMVLMPVADGLAAEKQAAVWNETFVKQAIVELGLNRRQTLGEFYDKNKNKFPKGVQDLMGPYIKESRNELIPQFEVSTLRNASGEKVPVIRVSKGSDLFNIELHNNEKFFAKIGNTEFSQANIQNFTDMFTKLYADEPKFRKLGEDSTSGPSSANSPSARSKLAYPELTKDIWKSMTPQERVAHIRNLRLLWGQARDVLKYDKSGKSKNRKTSSIDAFDNFFLLLLGDDAEAQARADQKVQRSDSPPADAPGLVEVNPNDACLVAGYVTNYKGKKCTISAIKERYSKADSRGQDKLRSDFEVKFFNEAWKDCKPDVQIACNPMIYGVQSSGKAICVDVVNNPNDIKKDFQRATHFNGPCETGTLLKGTGTSFLEKEDKFDGDRYSEKNRTKSDEQIRKELLEKEEKAGFAETKSFVEALLKRKAALGGGDDTLYKFFIDGEGEMTEALLLQLQTIQKAFTGQINEAKEACALSAGRKDHEKNFYGACDQMHRRQLFVAQYLQSKSKFKCPDGSKMDDETLMCGCPNNVSVKPGAKSCSGGDSASTALCPAPFEQEGASTCICKSNRFSTSPDLLKNLSKAELAKRCPSPVTSGEGECPTGMQSDRTGGDLQCICASGTGAWTKDQLATALKGKTVAQLCGPATAGATGDPAADAGKCSADSVKPTCSGGKVSECKPLTSSSTQYSWQCPAGSTDESKPGWGTRILGWLKKAAPWLAVAAGLWWINKKAPRPQPIAPPPDTCGAGQQPCTTACPNTNHVRSPIAPYACGCRPDTDFDYVDNQQTCNRVPRSTSTTTEVTCGDGVTKAATSDLCPKIDCQDGSKVFVGQTCPPESLSTTPNSSSKPGGVQQ